MTNESDVFTSLSDDIQNAIGELGWTQPMPVQEKAIPLMRSGRDLIVKALTGSGKTGAFARTRSRSIPPVGSSWRTGVSSAMACAVGSISLVSSSSSVST